MKSAGGTTSLKNHIFFNLRFFPIFSNSNRTPTDIQLQCKFNPNPTEIQSKSNQQPNKNSTKMQPKSNREKHVVVVAIRAVKVSRTLTRYWTEFEPNLNRIYAQIQPKFKLLPQIELNFSWIYAQIRQKSNRCRTKMQPKCNEDDSNQNPIESQRKDDRISIKILPKAYSNCTSIKIQPKLVVVPVALVAPVARKLFVKNYMSTRSSEVCKNAQRSAIFGEAVKTKSKKV